MEGIHSGGNYKSYSVWSGMQPMHSNRSASLTFSEQFGDTDISVQLGLEQPYQFALTLVGGAFPAHHFDKFNGESLRAMLANGFIQLPVMIFCFRSAYMFLPAALKGFVDRAGLNLRHTDIHS